MVEILRVYIILPEKKVSRRNSLYVPVFLTIIYGHFRVSSSKATTLSRQNHYYAFTVNKADLWESLHSASCLPSWKPGFCGAHNLEHPDGLGSQLE